MPGSTSHPSKPIPTASKCGSRLLRKRVDFIREPVAPSDESSPAQASRGGESDEEGLIIDPERMGKICNKLKEPDPWPDQFAESMKGRQENITKKLKEFRLKSTSDEQTFKAAFSPLMKTALAGLADDSATSPSSSAVPIHVPFLGPEGQPYCDGLVNLMRQSDTLTFAYDQLSGRGPQTSRLQDIRTSFEKDKEVAVATLEAGKQVAKIEIERLLADKFQEVRTPHDLTADDMNKGRLLLSRGAVNNTSLKQPLGWGNVARDTERAMENLCCAGQGNGRNH